MRVHCVLSFRSGAGLACQREIRNVIVDEDSLLAGGTPQIIIIFLCICFFTCTTYGIGYGALTVSEVLERKVDSLRYRYYSTALVRVFILT